jgi:GLPGLI family protein
MMRVFLIALLFITSSFSIVSAQAGQLVSDCTVFYTINVGETQASATSKLMEGATKIVYIKGSKSRSDLETPGFKQTTIYDTKSDSTVVLREVGNTKYISYLNNDKRKEKNKKFEGIQFLNTTDKKVILGYECTKVVAKLANGTAFDVYYTPAIVPSNSLYEDQFKDLPGFVLEYESQTDDGKTKVKYTATKIILVPVPGAKFDLPTAGYRVL